MILNLADDINKEGGIPTYCDADSILYGKEYYLNWEFNKDSVDDIIIFSPKRLVELPITTILQNSEYFTISSTSDSQDKGLLCSNSTKIYIEIE